MNGKRCSALALLLGSLLIASGCAQVPPQSVQLSDTIGRDLRAIEASHKKFVDIVYDKYESDVNNFVDTTYVPFYVRESLGNTASGKELLRSLQAAAQPDPSGKTQTDAMEKAELWLQVAHRRIEGTRSKLLEPLKKQRADIHAGLDGAYERVIRANAAVTGYLASLAKVTDLQNNLLAQLGVPNLSERVGEAAVQISANLNETIKEGNQRAEQAEALRTRLEEFLKRWRENPKGPSP